MRPADIRPWPAARLAKKLHATLATPARVKPGAMAPRLLHLTMRARKNPARSMQPI